MLGTIGWMTTPIHGVMLLWFLEDMAEVHKRLLLVKDTGSNCEYTQCQG